MTTRGKTTPDDEAGTNKPTAPAKSIPAKGAPTYIANTTIALPDGSSIYAGQAIPPGALTDEEIAALVEKGELREAAPV